MKDDNKTWNLEPSFTVGSVAYSVWNGMYYKADLNIDNAFYLCTEDEYRRAEKEND